MLFCLDMILCMLGVANDPDVGLPGKDPSVVANSYFYVDPALPLIHPKKVSLKVKGTLRKGNSIWIPYGPT
jgi:hypothetical protein